MPPGLTSEWAGAAGGIGTRKTHGLTNGRDPRFEGHTKHNDSVTECSGQEASICLWCYISLVSTVRLTSSAGCLALHTSSLVALPFCLVTLLALPFSPGQHGCMQHNM